MYGYIMYEKALRALLCYTNLNTQFYKCRYMNLRIIMKAIF